MDHNIYLICCVLLYFKKYIYYKYMYAFLWEYFFSLLLLYALVKIPFWGFFFLLSLSLRSIWCDLENDALKGQSCHFNQRSQSLGWSSENRENSILIFFSELRPKVTYLWPLIELVELSLYLVLIIKETMNMLPDFFYRMFTSLNLNLGLLKKMHWSNFGCFQALSHKTFFLQAREI